MESNIKKYTTIAGALLIFITLFAVTPEVLNNVFGFSALAIYSLLFVLAYSAAFIYFEVL